MKNKSLSVKKGRYLVAFAFVMSLNIALAVFLLTTSFGQTSENKVLKPLRVEVARQNDSPIKITITNVDNSKGSYQTVYYAIQNSSSKAISAYTFLGTTTPGAVKTSTKYNVAKLFQPNEVSESEWFEENENIKPDEPLSLSVDYVRFEDGSFWGADTQKQSETITGHFAGRLKAINEIKEFIKNQNINSVNDFLKRKRNESIFPPSGSGETQKWQIGFEQGYNVVLNHLLFIYEKKGVKEVPSKLAEIESITRGGQINEIP